jgi:hypothetical protein
MNMEVPLKDVNILFECDDCKKTKKIDLIVLAFSDPPQCCEVPMEIVHANVKV